MINEWNRRDFLRATALVGTGALMTPAVAGCSALGFGNTLEDIKSAGRITVGIAGEVPYSFTDDDGLLTGAIGDLHREIFRRIGDIGVESVEVPFGQLLEGLDKGNFDTVAAGMFILTDRCDRAAFSEPVYCAPSALLVASGNPEGLSDYVSVAEAGVGIAVLGAAVEAEYAKEAGVASGDIRSVGSQASGLELVASGEVAAFALTALSLRALVESAGEGDLDDLPPDKAQRLVDEVEVLDPFVPVVDGDELLGCGGAAFRSNEKDLRDAFNAELAALRDSGELMEILQPWGFTDAEIPPADLTTEQLCDTGGLSGDVKAPVPR